MKAGLVSWHPFLASLQSLPMQALSPYNKHGRASTTQRPSLSLAQTPNQKVQCVSITCQPGRDMIGAE
jgi:hypothetical protein